MSRETLRVFGMAVVIAALMALPSLALTWRLANRLPPVLVYDQAQIDQQAQAYIARGFDGVTVINQAFDRAKERGHLILRAGKDIAYPDAALFRISDFVAEP